MAVKKSKKTTKTTAKKSIRTVKNKINLETLTEKIEKKPFENIYEILLQSNFNPIVLICYDQKDFITNSYVYKENEWVKILQENKKALKKISIETKEDFNKIFPEVLPEDELSLLKFEYNLGKNNYDLLLFTNQEIKLTQKDKNNLEYIKNVLLLHIQIFIYKDIINEFEKKIKQINQEHQGEINSLNKEIQEIISNHENQIKELNKKHQEQIEQIKNELIQNKNNEIQNIIAQHQNQINELNKKYREQIESLNKKIENIIAQHQNQINELNKKYQEQIEQIKNELIQNKNNEIQNIIAQHQKQINELNKKYQEQIDALNKEIQKITNEYQKRINDLTEKYHKEIEIKNNYIADQQSYFEKIIREKQEKIDELLQKENLLTNNLYESNQKIQQLEVIIQDKNSEIQKIKNEYDLRILKLEEENLIIVEDLNKNISQLKEEIEKLENHLKEKINQIKNKDEEIVQLNKNITQLNELTENQKREIDTLIKNIHEKNETIIKIEKEYKERIQILSENYQKEIQNLKIESQRLISLIKEKESLIEELQKQIHQKNNLIQNLEKELNSLSFNLEQTKKEKELIELQLKEEKEVIKEKNELIRKHHIQIQNLEKENKQKENLILNLETEINHHKNTLKEKEKNIQEFENKLNQLQQENQNHLNTIENLKNELNVKIEDLNKLKKELENSLMREKLSKQMGNIIINSILSLSEMADFSSRLEYIENFVFPEKPKRFTIFKINNQNLILYMTNLNIRNFYLDLSETIFGQVIADRQIETSLKKKNQPPYDLTINHKQIHYYLEEELNPIKQYYQQSLNDEEYYIALPIVANNETIGICTFVFFASIKDKIEPQTLQLLENLIPVLSTSFENDEFKKKNQQIFDSFYSIKDLENIFLYKQNKSNDYIFSYNLKKENQEKILKKEDLLYFIYSKVFEIPKLSQKQLTKELIDEFLTTIEEVLFRSEYIFKKPSFNHWDFIVEKFQDYPSYFFWVLIEFFLNAILHSEGKIFGIELYNDEKFHILKLYDDGEGILRKTGSYFPEKGTGIKLFQNIANLINAKLIITKGLDSFGTSIEFHWDKFFIHFENLY